MKKKNERSEIIRGLSLLSQLGVTVTACVLTGVFLGKSLDGFFGSSPWFLLVFSFFGMAAAFKALYSLMKNK